MASPLPDIPAQFFDPSQKYPLIVWLVQTGVPARIARTVLSDWGLALGVEITSSDYDMINRRLAPLPLPGKGF